MPSGAGRTLKIGVLALQGAFAEHIAAFGELGFPASSVRCPEDLDAVDALVVPGGESTAIVKLAASTGLDDEIRSRLRGGMPAMGTCAGMIFLASEVTDGIEGQTGLGAIDISVRRNAFGRQIRSFEADVELSGVGGGPFRAVFIRAPGIDQAGPEVELLASLDGKGVAARSRGILVTAFHPELTPDLRIHKLFLEIASEA